MPHGLIEIPNCWDGRQRDGRVNCGLWPVLLKIFLSNRHLHVVMCLGKPDGWPVGIASFGFDRSTKSTHCAAAVGVSLARSVGACGSRGFAAPCHEGDRDHDNLSGSDPNSRGAGGLGGFKLVGMVLGMAVPSRALGYSMGAYGAGMSVYSHFIARGNEVVFPKNTAMEIGIGTRGLGNICASGFTYAMTLAVL